MTLQDLRKSNNTPDVICLSETFLKQGSEQYATLSKYHMISSFSRQQPRGGTCVFVAQNLEAKDMTFICENALEKSFECCGVEVPFNNLIILCLYRTPASNPEIIYTKFRCSNV